MKQRILLIIAVCFWLPFSIAAQNSKARSYTQERPLVYEDVWDLWPYSFLNDNGEPDGFNIDLVRLIFKELKIPYIIKLKSSQETFNDLRDGRSDLTLGLSAGYHDEYGLYGQNAITLFTQSVVTPKSKPIEIYSLKDLGKHQVIVNNNSFCYHVMVDHGWSENAIPTKDIKDAIQKVSAEEEGQIVWNELSLKWLVKQYQLDNLTITPVNMSHGEYKFMSNDQQLLATLDSIYSVLYTEEKLTAIQNKWFYPERQEKEIPAWLWYVAGFMGLLGIIFLIYLINYHIQGRHIKQENRIRNKRLSLIIETSQVRIWTFDIATKLFTWHSENGQAAYTYTAEEFANRYHPEDFKKLMEQLKKLENMEDEKKEEKEITINLKAIDSEDGDAEWHDFIIVLSVLRRDKNGRPSVIIGTKKDITQQRRQVRLSEEHTIRYWAIFETPMIGILLFDKEGVLCNINKKACEIFHCDHDDIIARKVTFQKMLGIKNLDMKNSDGFQATRQDLKIHLNTVTGKNHELIGMFAFCNDITQTTTENERLHQTEKQLLQTESLMYDYRSHINYILQKGNMRLVGYSPLSHTLTIYQQVDTTQLTLTQTRCMTLVDSRQRRKAMHMLSDMDSCMDKNIEADIKTTIRGNGGLTLHLYFLLMPFKNNAGEVTEFFGLCQDISEREKAESLMAIETLKAQEIENTQNKFLGNMLQEIRTPLSIVVEHAAKLNANERLDSEEEDNKAIMLQSRNLLDLITNILYMSRLEAHMVEINKQPTDFAELFQSFCTNGWSQHKMEDVRYIVENPYETLVIDIDAANLGQVIERVVSMSANHTNHGTIRARYDYIGRKLIISIDDTGEGISEEEQQLIHKEYSRSHSSKGLNLSICKELIDQMGGTFEINSEKGLGTTTWITLPCQASIIKRRKII